SPSTPGESAPSPPPPSSYSNFRNPPDEKTSLHHLARLVVDHEMPHLDRDWDAEDRIHRAHLDAILPIDQLDEVLRSHPNSQINVRKRMRDAQSDDGQSK
ncbi:hypothetical protein, partial [Kribbella caucasensis]|uniref:hypothetical protein n=1 Tax=Kribbella caucasensis TaxID=2512215 RepID=UPI001EE02460